MKARIYQGYFGGWHWEIQYSYDSMGGYAFTKLGAEYAARRAWKNINKTRESYEIDLDKA